MPDSYTIATDLSGSLAPGREILLVPLDCEPGPIVGAQRAQRNHVPALLNDQRQLHQGHQGTLAIVIQRDLEHGLWQR
jgi:hypothetical protein